MISVIFSLLLLLSSCGGTEKTLWADSCDYSRPLELKAAEIDREQIEKWADTEFEEYVCYVSISDGKLIISKSAETKESHIMAGNNGYFIGVDLGEFDGFIEYRSYHSAWSEDWTPPVTAMSETVIPENCRGFVKADNTYGYALTGYSHMFTDEGAIYKLTFPTANSYYTCTKICELSACPRAYTYDGESEAVYIATTNELLLLSLKDDTVKVLADISVFSPLGTTSMVYTDGKIYIGMCMGIYEYDTKTNDSAWYPLDIEKYAK